MPMARPRTSEKRSTGRLIEGGTGAAYLFARGWPRGSRSAAKAPAPFKNRNKVLVLSSRGVGYRIRHLMQDLIDLLPHWLVSVLCDVVSALRRQSLVGMLHSGTYPLRLFALVHPDPAERDAARARLLTCSPLPLRAPAGACNGILCSLLPRRPRT